MLDKGSADSDGTVTFARARRAKQEQMGCLTEPDIAGGECRHRGLAEHGHRGEVEVLECFGLRQAGFGEMPLDTAAAPLREFQLRQRGEEAGGGPSLLVGPFGKVRPEPGDGGERRSLRSSGRQVVSTSIVLIMLGSRPAAPRAERHRRWPPGGRG